MKTRREFVLGLLVLCIATAGATGASAASKSAPLDVTYYFLPG